jgi:hypothetical protein
MILPFILNLAQAIASILEPGAATDSTSASLVRAALVSETGSAVDTCSATIVRAASVSESGGATDVQSATTVLNCQYLGISVGNRQREWPCSNPCFDN